MKLKLIVKLGELLLGTAFSDDQPRADMCLPVKILAMSIMLMVFGIGLGILAAIKLSLSAAIAAVICLPFGVISFLCWRNQTIHIISDELFVYRTFLGNERVYRFDQINGFVLHHDSGTLYVRNEKVHMERCAHLTKRLSAKINQELKRVQAELEAKTDGHSSYN